jgi:3'-5' exoribonuclease
MNIPFESSAPMTALHAAFGPATHPLNHFPASIPATNAEPAASPREERRAPPVADRWPPLMRIVSLERTLDASHKVRNRAVLFHESCSLSVEWITQQADCRLHRHGLVTIRWGSALRCEDGAVRIERPIPADRPDATTNLFATIPYSWVKTPDRDLVKRAMGLWETLPRPLAHLFNAVLWESSRFHRYVLGPSSLAHHHLNLTGNFRHCVEVAEQGVLMAATTPRANRGLLIAAGLLHDAAKADEYVLDRRTGRFVLSPRGEMLGHRATILEWLAVARAMAGVVMSDALYLELAHVISAVKGAPHWLGMREPRCIEAEILSMADRLSGEAEVMERLGPQETGFGRRHPQTGRRLYLTQGPE